MSEDVRGQWWAGDNEEFYRVGPYGSREEALGEAWGYFGNDRPIHLLRAELAEWSPPDGASIIDMMIDTSDELFFEDGFDGMAGTKEAVAQAEAELDALMRDWLNRYRDIFPTPTTFGWTADREVVPAQVGRNPKGEDLQGLRAEHEHAVAEGHAPNHDITRKETGSGQ